MIRQGDRAALVRAFEDGRVAGDVEAMASAAMAMAANSAFGTHLGTAPAYLHEAHQLADGALRVRLGVALTRAWVYGSEPARAVPFAVEAVAEAGRLGDPALLAEALDAELLVHWGPDDLTERLRITSRLEDVVAHLPGVEVRLMSHLWRLTTALENLDPTAVRRQLRALDDLAEESGSARVRMFAASRRAMFALVGSDLAATRELAEVAVRAGEESGAADTEALRHVFAAWIARQRGDLGELAREAAAFEEFGAAQGIGVILAESAQLWLEAGFPERARGLLRQVAGGGLASIPRDLDWLMTVATASDVAIGTGELGLLAEASELLAPYAGRGVLNAGGVAFLGVVDDYLAHACAALGRDDESAAWAASAAAAYDRIGARWWQDRAVAGPVLGAVAGSVAGAVSGPVAGAVSASAPAAAPMPAPMTAPMPAPMTAPIEAHLVPGAGGVWLVGRTGATVPVRSMKGFSYLRMLLQSPGMEVSALELTAAAAGQPRAVPDSDLGEVLDRQALAAYRQRIIDLDAELAEARSWADQGRVAALAAERGMLLDEVAAATGLLGRPRRAGASAERARVAVQKALTAAIARIAEVEPNLGRFLEDTIRTGTRCSYHPDPARPVRWLLTPVSTPRA